MHHLIPRLSKFCLVSVLISSLELVLYPTKTKYPADVFQLRQGEHISLVRDPKDGIHLLGRGKGNGCRNPTNLVLSLILRVSDNIHD